ERHVERLGRNIEMHLLARGAGQREVGHQAESSKNEHRAHEGHGTWLRRVAMPSSNGRTAIGTDVGARNEIFFAPCPYVPLPNTLMLGQASGRRVAERLWQCKNRTTRRTRSTLPGPTLDSIAASCTAISCAASATVRTRATWRRKLTCATCSCRTPARCAGPAGIFFASP